MRARRSKFWLPPVLATSLMAASCGDDPPDREIQQAQVAIESARSAGANDYAHDEFTAAEKALSNAREAVTQRDYRLALTHAIDSRERAQTAAKESADQRQVARSAIERGLRDTTGVLAQTMTRLKNAEASRAPARVLADPRRAIHTADRSLQEARTAFAKEDYAAARTALDGANEQLAVAARELSRPDVALPHRRR